MIGRLHEPTGAQYRLLTAEKSFSDYIIDARELISQHRIDLDTPQASTIIEANAPFEWRPHPGEHFKKGILLIHGLYDSPFSLRDIGAHFLKQGYLVRAILLPGHGTVPGDLLKVHRQDWLNTVANAITSTSAVVDDLYIGGYSLGGALSLLSHTLVKNLRAMILIAPGLKPRNWKAHFLKILRLMTWISKKAKWYQISNQINYAKYTSHSYNASHQAFEIMKAAAKIRTNIPLFLVASADDETIDTAHLIQYFEEQMNGQNAMIVYAKASSNQHSPSIEYRCSAYPEKNIIDFSHTCLPISPNNAYLGEHGQWLDFSHYHNAKDQQEKAIRIGAITTTNLLHYTMQRLSYNPDFDHMARRFSHFIENLK